VYLIEQLVAIRSELIAVAATSLVVFLAERVRTAVVNLRISKKYPVGGRYAATYEDVDDGKVSSKKSELTVRQSGRKIVGVDKNLSDRRDWELSGSILDHGYIAGIYGRLDPNDPSKGTFFMEPSVGVVGEYTGHWAGLDSVNRKLLSGTYRWKKILQCQTRQLRQADAALTDEILAIFSESLGSRFIDRDEVVKYLDEVSQMYVFGAFVKNRRFGKSEMVGVRTVKILNEQEKHEFQEMVHKHGGTCDLRLLKVGMLKSNAVRTRYRRSGIGSQLVKCGSELLKDKGCRAIVSISWASNANESSSSVLEAHDFRLVCKVDGYWKDDSLARDYDCPRCGRPPCKCSASIYLHVV
jgi:L-amino acid N-acyltransferase YncA